MLRPRNHSESSRSHPSSSTLTSSSILHIPEDHLEPDTPAIHYSYDPEDNKHSPQMSEGYFGDDKAALMGNGIQARRGVGLPTLALGGISMKSKKSTRLGMFGWHGNDTFRMLLTTTSRFISTSLVNPGNHRWPSPVIQNNSS